MDGDAFSLAKLLGEYFREVSVLVFVFGFLDALAPRGDSGFGTVTVSWGSFVLGVSIFFFAVGAITEWLRKR